MTNIPLLNAVFILAIIIGASLWLAMFYRVLWHIAHSLARIAANVEGWRERFESATRQGRKES